MSRIKYPAFELLSDNWNSVDGLIYVDGLLVDDRNQPGTTLGVRRLQTPFEDLYPLKRAVETPIALLKQPSNKFWVDKSGKMFYYTKTRMAKVKYRKIKKIERKITSTVVWLEGINHNFIVDRPPPDHCLWAGVLYVDNLPWILYDYSSEKLSDLVRKI